MKRLLQTFGLIILVATALQAQRAPVTVVSPPGLEEPYEVAAGTSVTFQVDFNGSAPTFFYSSATEPVFPDFGPDPNWQTHTNFTSAGNGKYNITFTVNGPLYVWAGIQSTFIGWTFSSVALVSIASGVELSYPNGFLCSTGSNSEVLSVKGTFASYQWYRDNEAIPGATSATYTATTEGAYKVSVPRDGKNVFSNTLHLRSASIAFTGALSGTNLTLTASDGLTSYQWLSGNTANALTEISAATSKTYTAALVAQTKYYAVKGTKGGCEIQSPARAANTAIFTKPVITVTAETNSLGRICLGTPATLSVPETYGSYAWYLDGNDYFSQGHEIMAYEETGNFRADVSPAAWPEITISSANKKVGYVTVIEPSLIGPANNSTHCPGATIKETLNDEGYEYKWYLHTSYNYTAADQVTPVNYAYTFTFTEAVYLTVHATSKSSGCESETKYHFDSYDDATLFLNLSDYEKEYLCEGSTVDLIIDQADQFTDIKWYKGEELIDGETGSTYTVSEPGAYYATAKPTGCATSLLTSNTRQIHSFTERELYIMSDKETMCEGEKATLTVGEEWTAVQWFEKNIKISNSGYVEEYVPIEGAGAAHSLEVSKYTGYLVKAKHQSCDAGTKIWSAPLEIRPSLNPNIKVEPWEGDPRRWHKAYFDSIPNYLFCDEAPVNLSVDSEETYDTYEWLMKQYNGDGDYTPGNKLEGETSSTVDIKSWGARWYTAKITKGNCVGYSDAVLIDTWVHITPAISAVGTAELCGDGDTLPLAVAFKSNWVKYEWYNYGELMPDTNTDTLIVTEPGAYTVTGYPEECPHIGYSSGLPVVVKYFPEVSIEEAEEEGEGYIYAFPWEGYYTFQWYFNGQPLTVRNLDENAEPITGFYALDTNTDTEDDADEGYLWKRRMKPGVYTLHVANWDECSGDSQEYVWNITGNEPEEEYVGVAAHPNPTSGTVTLKGFTKDQIKTVGVTSAQGQSVPSYFNAADQTVDLSSLPAGVYIIEVTLNNQSKKSVRVLRK
jgi:hypothetical protein